MISLNFCFRKKNGGKILNKSKETRKSSYLEKSNLILSLLLIIFIIPFAPTSGLIWSQSKTFILFLLAINNIGIVKRYYKDFLFNYSKWLPFIIIAWISTNYSAYPLISLTGGGIGDGLIFWVLLSIVVTEFETIKIYNSRIIKALKKGFIIGGTIAVVLAIPQLYFKHIDYTIFSLLENTNDGKTLLGISYEKQPISLFSHRGHFSAVCLCLYYIAESRMKFIFIFGALISQTRATIVIITTSIVKQLSLFKQDYLLNIIILIISFSLFYHLSINKTLYTSSTPPKLPFYMAIKSINIVSSGRIHSIKIGIRRLTTKATLKNLIIGYGMAPALQSNDVEYTKSYRYHNYIFDKLISVGILGFIFFNVIVWKFYKLNNELMLSYIIFSLFWFDSSQYTSLFFIGCIANTYNKQSYKKIKRSGQKQKKKKE